MNECIDHNQVGNRQGYGHSKRSTKFNEFGVANLARTFNVDPNTIYNIIKERTHIENLVP